ncbi:MAG: hypothetical protein GJ680_06535 [Alteromonadaceae bacterium]|nr:hypothetical protein [Alteromonadaceae bacterium]
MIVLAAFLPQVSVMIPTVLAVMVTGIALLGGANKWVFANYKGVFMLKELNITAKEKGNE